MNQSRLFFDIETLANPETLGLMAEPKAPANLKDPEKIAQAIADKKQEMIDTAALDPDYGKILSIGYATSPDGPVTVHLLNELYSAEKTYTESDLINGFWNLLTQCNGCCAGYNVLSFDLPYLLRRSMALGISVPLIPNLAKFRTEPVTDLMAILYNWGSDKYKGLKQVAKIYGIPNEIEGIDGSKIKDLSPDELRKYQASDVKLVQALYKRMNGVYFKH